jgi:hypothetical protein
MHENTHQQSTKPQSLESNEKMKGLMPPAFGFADGEAEGNVVPNVQYSSRIEYSEGEPKGVFGITLPKVSAEQMKVTPEGDKFNVAANLVCYPQVEIWAGDNCLGKYANVEDANSPKITAANYRLVAKDMTPNAKGRTNPSNFWCKPLVLKHENFHAKDMISRGEDLLEKAKTRMSKRTISSKEQGITMLEELSFDLNYDIDSEMKAVDSEMPAYLDGREGYLELATAIMKKGNSGGYK